eukprot:g36520.t1
MFPRPTSGSSSRCLLLCFVKASAAIKHLKRTPLTSLPNSPPFRISVRSNQPLRRILAQSNRPKQMISPGQALQSVPAAFQASGTKEFRLSTPAKSRSLEASESRPSRKRVSACSKA